MVVIEFKLKLNRFYRFTRNFIGLLKKEWIQSGKKISIQTRKNLTSQIPRNVFQNSDFPDLSNHFNQLKSSNH